MNVRIWMAAVILGVFANSCGDKNENPPKPVVSPKTLQVEENAAKGTIVGSVVDQSETNEDFSFTIIDSDPSNAFEIAPNGSITVANSEMLDYETTPAYLLTINIVDTQHNLSAETTVTVNLVDVDDDVPSITNKTLTVEENAADGTTVGSSVAESEANPNYRLSIESGNELGGFAIDEVSGIITVLDADVLDYEEHETFELTVRVTDIENELTSTAVVTIELIDHLEINVAGTYEHTALMYYRIGQSFNDVAETVIGAELIIGSVDENTFSYNDMWGIFSWPGSKFHFSIDVAAKDENGNYPIVNYEFPDGLYSGDRPLTCATEPGNLSNVGCGAGRNYFDPDESGAGAHKLYMTYGYYVDNSGPREFYVELTRVGE